ncbi:BadF/BadG/BcrA/BcrD ATPase family protein [Alteromonas facilis]|uniref:BadF/BadG/BcrA/BcrD ATPase family protein n=1 Tax=Alteromonas facilis TaxID=2048004 RepID=UPI000C283B13|nr:BadF/BadG/BcrA/BcrD ATPase family protein [Alteromonas facilis]
MTKAPFYVGVDGGGTKCKAVIFDNDLSAIAEGIAGPANVARDPVLAIRSIEQAITNAIAKLSFANELRLSDLHVSAGLAGANITSAAEHLGHWQHPFKSFEFMTDLKAATIGAHAGNDGAVLIVGTGSCSAAMRDHVLTQIGGHGFLLGDNGSGAWLGRRAVTETLETLDHVRAPSVLTDKVLAHTGATNSIELIEQFNILKPALFAQLAPIVFDAAIEQDPHALSIISQAADYLSTIAQQAITQSNGQLVLVGGVATAIQPWLTKSVQSAIVPAQHGPEWGAVFHHLQQEKIHYG